MFRTLTNTACISVLALGGLPSVACADASVPLLLADNGRTHYQIVIGNDADYGEDLAAKELGHFLWRITGAEFPVVGDSGPPTDFEIVLGNTNRKSPEDIPRELKTDNWEGFTILREGESLYIMGNIPRGTLYGVYDFLDVELGVRFLTAEVTHVPNRPVLEVAARSRMFAPKIERRTIWSSLGGRSIQRNRMNGHSFSVTSPRLGGVKWIGPPTHTFSSLVSADKHFDEHPEYFSEIDGERRREYDGIVTQLCLTNPEVREIALDTIRGWLGPEVKANPYNKYVVSVTVNDSIWFCKCDPCVAVNREEGVTEGGTKMRFVNAIATRLAREYPAVSVETMLYHTSMPKKTKPVSNVLIQLVYDPDWRYAFDDQSYEINRRALNRLGELSEAIGEGSIYNWTKHVTFVDFMIPYPNLRHIARNIRIMNENGVNGIYAQMSQSRGNEMQDLRYYLLARAMWRPEVDSRETIEEFCQLYYGKGGPDVLRYIDFLHDNYIVDRESWDRMRERLDYEVVYDGQFVSKADAILASAESRAETPEIKQRVATCRLPVWKIMLEEAMGEVGKVHSFPVEWHFKFDTQDEGLKQGWQRTTDFKDWGKMRIDKHWTMQGEERRGVAWYAMSFEMPDTKGSPLALHFGAVDGFYDVFVDGVKVGERHGMNLDMVWHDSFFVPLNDGLAPGPHHLVLRVRKDNYNAGIWKQVAIVDMSVPISDELRTAGERFIKVARAAGLLRWSETYAQPLGIQMEDFLYPKIEFFLTH